MGSIQCSKVSAELKSARSIVRLTEIQATLQEQRWVVIYCSFFTIFFSVFGLLELGTNVSYMIKSHTNFFSRLETKYYISILLELKWIRFCISNNVKCSSYEILKEGLQYFEKRGKYIDRYFVLYVNIPLEFVTYFVIHEIFACCYWNF